MEFDTFISYPHQDKAVADAACAKLESEGIRCWIAPRDVPPGDEWAGAIVDAIDNCRVMVLIFSEHSNQSKQVHREVQRAFDGEKAVIPFRIENIMPEKSLAYYMGSVHWLDALTPPVEEHLHKLVAAVHALVKAATSKNERSAEDQRGLEDAEAARQEEAAAVRRRAETAEARRLKEGRRKKEEEAKRHVEEEACRQREQVELKVRVERERQASDLEAKQRADEERAFANAKQADTVPALDEFLVAYPDRRLTAETTALRGALVARDDMFKSATATDDPVAAVEKENSAARDFAKKDQRRHQSGIMHAALVLWLVGVGLVGHSVLMLAVMYQNYGAIFVFPPMYKPDWLFLGVIIAACVSLILGSTILTLLRRQTLRSRRAIKGWQIICTASIVIYGLSAGLVTLDVIDFPHHFSANALVLFMSLFGALIEGMTLVCLISYASQNIK